MTGANLSLHMTDVNLSLHMTGVTLSFHMPGVTLTSHDRCHSLTLLTLDSLTGVTLDRCHLTGVTLSGQVSLTLDRCHSPAHMTCATHWPVVTNMTGVTLSGQVSLTLDRCHSLCPVAPHCLDESSQSLSAYLQAAQTIRQLPDATCLSAIKTNV